MTVNAALNVLLDQTVTVVRITDTVTRGYATVTTSSTVVGSVDAHIQPLTPEERQRQWGMEIQGDYQAFFNSTLTIIEGDYLKQTSGPSPDNQKRWWVRGVQPYDTSWAQHTEVLLERTTELSTL